VRLRDGRLRLSASDLANFLSCRHLTRLDVASAHGFVRPPVVHDIGAEALAERGIQHEARVLEGFRNQGRTIQDLQSVVGDPQEGVGATVEAMRAGVDVIYQGTLLVGDRLGLPDFLVRANPMSSPDEASLVYEVVDAKLARTAKARAVLQTTFYSLLVGELPSARRRLRGIQPSG
jgi:predicted RecB family nuclease